MNKILLFTFFIYIIAQQNIKADEIFDKGKTIFLQQGNCATCHTLMDAQSNGNIGPNLDEVKPDIMRVINTVTNGIGVMPAYEGELTNEEIEAVAYYVDKSANN